MDIELTSDGMKLTGNVVKEEINQLVDSLKTMLASEVITILVDLGAVEQLDVAALQVFIAAAKSADKSEKEIRFVSCNDSVKKTLELSGLEMMFEERL